MAVASSSSADVAAAVASATQRRISLDPKLKPGAIASTITLRHHGRRRNESNGADMANITAESVGVVPVDEVEFVPVGRKSGPQVGPRSARPAKHRGGHAQRRIDHATDGRVDPGRRGRVARGIDVVGASVGLLLTAPLLIVIAALIRVSSRGPVVFRHERLGRDLEPFQCLKFRTMHRDADRIIAELRRARPDIDAELASNFKLRDDPRITPMGRFLRRTSLDELPQLVNVLRGEMSLVGPRPIVSEEGAMYGPQLGLVLSVRPGMTGAWQVAGRNRICYPERVDIDIDYVNRKSVIVDLAILLKTPAALLDWRATS